ncbi:hypothetical protein POM88_044566 [Heracleum sosnowskyi]|uniref:Uncharacterized protein n=1 Tax=Heracleum sosnowskyi TaxID=360622 RepID=A0AAD8M5F3_9APIA|nr:hypothetical protein POM88_044566 [Heracleum sosnowskyi]
MKTSQQKQAIEFVYTVKQRFVAQPSKFDEFARILSELISSTGVKDLDFLVSKLKNLFTDDHQDLLLALNNFLPRNMKVVEKKESCDDNKYSWLLSDSDNEFFNKIRDRCIEKNDKSFSVLIKFCELIASCHDKRITVREVDAEFSDLFKDDPDLYIQCTELLADMWETSNEESGLDYSGFGFLNKRRKVVRRRSLFDKTMAVKEFYLYEMELGFSRIENTIVKLDQDPERFGECLTVHDKRCIVELYKGSDSDYTFKGEDLVEILQSCDPVRRIQARDVVLERLRKKMMLLEEQKLRLDHVWREIFEDIREKGAVYCHREFLDQMTEVSKNNYSD